MKPIVPGSTISSLREVMVSFVPNQVRPAHTLAWAGMPQIPVLQMRFLLAWDCRGCTVPQNRPEPENRLFGLLKWHGYSAH